eukprot:jgi/Bigna1/142563/aug1.71_g17271
MNVASTVVNPIQRHGLKRAICHRRFPQRTMAISHGDKKQGYVPFSARRSQIGLLIPRVFPNKNVRGISGGGSTTNLPEWTAEDDQVVGDIKGEIEQAIQRGAPVFNDGDPGGCCKIYLAMMALDTNKVHPSDKGHGWKGRKQILYGYVQDRSDYKMSVKERQNTYVGNIQAAITQLLSRRSFDIFHSALRIVVSLLLVLHRLSFSFSSRFANLRAD